MAGFNGKWVYAESSNLDQWINTVVPEERREQARINSLNSTVEFKVEGNSITYNSSNPEGKKSVTFTPGQEFDFTMGSGKTVKAVWTTISDNKAEVKVSLGDKEGKLAFEIDGNIATVNASYKDVTNVTKYKKA